MAATRVADNKLDETNGSLLVVTASCFLTLTYLSVGLRTYVRGVLTKSFQADDWFMLVAQINFTLSCSFILIGVHDGVGSHNRALPQDKEIVALKWQALATATYVLNMMFIKLSIGVFLLRLAMSNRYKYTLWISMAVVTIWSIVIFFWDIFQCDPVEKQWDYTIPEGHCVTADEIVNAAYSISVMTILTDWLYAILPMFMVWKVKMSKQAKLTVVVVLGLGVFASVATLIRLKFLSDLTETDDILFAGTDAMVWTLIEPGVAIVASSLVTIRPLLRAMKLKGFESTNPSYGNATGGRSRSRTMRSATQRPGGMPGYGPGDLNQPDLEAASYELDSKHVSIALPLQANTSTIAIAHLARPTDRRNTLDAIMSKELPQLPQLPKDEEEEEEHSVNKGADQGGHGPGHGHAQSYDYSRGRGGEQMVRDFGYAPSARTGHNELYVHNGQATCKTWITQRQPTVLNSPSSTSFDQIHDLDAQSQDSGRVGLGFSGRR